LRERRHAIGDRAQLSITERIGIGTLLARPFRMPTVADYMNRELVYLEEGDRPELALVPMLDLGLTAVPVLDDEHRPVGVVSMRDLADPRQARHQVSSPARTIWVGESLDAAARVLADCAVHHLVVVDADGRATGMLSAKDVLRALLALPPSAPAAFTRSRLRRLEVP
jgi:CBS-domain-containing membrane protein